MDPTSFIKDVSSQLAGLRRARELYSPSIAPDFNVLSILQPNELRLSGLLAELLRPDGRHAQKETFLRLFLKRFKLTHLGAATMKAKVKTESPADRSDRPQRRLDILIELEPRGKICIENKPWAMDQQNQVKDYLSHLEKNEEHCLIYLSGQGSPPSNLKDEECNEYIKEKRLVIIGYNGLICWLNDCRIECKSLRVNVFLEEIIDYINKEFTGDKDMEERDAIISSAMNNDESLMATLEICMRLDDIKKYLLEKLGEQIKEKFTILKNSIVNVDLSLDQYAGFNILFNTDSCYVLCFEFSAGGCSNPIYGVAKTDKKYPDLEPLRAHLNKNIGAGRCSEYWIWYRIFKPVDWKYATNPWVMIYRGEMADLIVNKIIKVYDELEKGNFLNHLLAPSR